MRLLHLTAGSLAFAAVAYALASLPGILSARDSTMHQPTTITAGR